MKKVCKKIAFASFIGVLFVLAGCQSTKVDLQQYTPTAVVTVYGNSSIPWYVEFSEMKSDSDNDTGGMLSGLVNRALGANNPEIQTVNSRIDTAAEIVKRVLEQQGQMTVIDHKIIENTPTFKNSGNSFLNNVGDDVPAEGYKIINSGSSKFNKRIAQEAGIKSTVFVVFKFQKQKVADGLTKRRAAARVTMNISIADEKGKKVWRKEYFAISTNSVEYNNGNWDKQALCDLFPEAIEAVMDQFVFDITGDKGTTAVPAASDNSAAADDSTAAASTDTSVEATPIAIPAGVKQSSEDGTASDSTAAEGTVTTEPKTDSAAE